MHDRKLLSDNGPEGAEITARGLPAVQPAERPPSRTPFWAIVGFCIAGLICSLFVPASYLHIEQTATMIAEAPLS